MSRAPTLPDYLSRLPDGLDSYPQVQSKSSLLRSSIEGHEEASLEGAPQEICELFRAPPPPTVWVPAVQVNAVFHVIVDHYYATDQEVIEWSRRRTEQMGDNSIYRSIVSFTSPRMLFRISREIDRMFQKGTRVTAEFDGARAAIEITHPPHLSSRLKHLSNIGMFEALIASTGGREPTCEMTESRPDGATFDLRWTDP